ncbi:MAG: DUF1848 domain-containing protein [Burkholderiales bacterium]
MIISASRRTDIPAYFSDWFYNRIKAGEVLVRNPLYTRQVSRINLSPEVVDCIVFWTKNPKPMLERLDELKDYHFYFQFTLNSYGNDVEANLPKREIIDTFRTLSDKIGKERVIWRYDPIFINEKYTIDCHEESFNKIADALKGYTEKCIISFIDFYNNIKSNIKNLGIIELDNIEKRKIAEKLSKVAFSYGLKMDTCAENIKLADLGITHARCIDDSLISRITGCPLKAEKDKNQRLACGCVASIDIGLYNTCRNGCKYCYANHNQNTVKSNYRKYDKNSPLLCSRIEETDKIYERHVESLKQKQEQIVFGI